MSISINVGLSRKSSVDFQSQGQSINLTAELDQFLLARPRELQAQIAALYAEAQTALDQAGRGPAVTDDAPSGRVSASSHGPATGNGRVSPEASVQSAGNGTAHQPSNGHRPTEACLTASQRRAIYAIAKRHNLDAQTACADEYGVALDDLTVRQASKFIDFLLQSPTTGGRKVGAR